MFIRYSCMLLLFAATTTTSIGQGLPIKLPTAKKDSTKNKGSLNNLLKQTLGATPLSADEASQALKQALEIGAGKASKKLNLTDGFFGNAAIKILLPPEAQQVERTLRKLGMGKLVDDAILSMNRSAEQAAGKAAPIFTDAIRGITISDALNIVRGSDTAATAFLRNKTTQPLTQVFRPVVDSALQRTDATQYWQALFNQYNRFAAKKINPDLGAYVTEKALQGMFVQLGQEEKEIRRNPVARTTELLQKAFGRK